tara:strand:+ start:220 stop:714 length:495 start_codon:yes stop_codon:yes gene_type:complete
MKNNKFIAMAVAATLALTSCDKREEQYEQDMINSCNVKAMTGIEVHWRAYSVCTGLDTSGIKEYASCYVVNIGKLPEINDVRYDDYEFYAMIDGKKVIGSAMITNKLNIIASDLVYDLVFDQFSHDELNLIIPIEKLYNAKFYVSTNGNTRELRLDEVYRGLDN